VFERDIEEAIQFANLCARVAVQKTGTYAVTVEDVNDDLLF
jgi:bifunctional ADP-heptose synthase (sugar kinase/adenylyltransferase)